MARFKPRPITWNGTRYPSVKEAASALYVSYGQMWRRIQKGYTCDEDLHRGLRRPVVWNGIRYPSLHHAAEALGISYQAVISRLRKGYTCDEDMIFPPQAK